MKPRRFELKDLGFHHTSEAWYAKTTFLDPHDPDIVDEVNFGFYPEDGGTYGEMTMNWHRLEKHRPPCPRLNVFSDGWLALINIPGLLKSLAEYDSYTDGDRLTPKGFCDLLKELGFRDLTRREQPK